MKFAIKLLLVENATSKSVLRESKIKRFWTIMGYHFYPDVAAPVD